MDSKITEGAMFRFLMSKINIQVDTTKGNVYGLRFFSYMIFITMLENTTAMINMMNNKIVG